VFASQIALLGFFHDSSLLFSPGTSHLKVEDYSCQSKRERERERAHGVNRRRRKKQKKPMEKKHFAGTRILTHRLCLQNQAPYQLDPAAEYYN